MHTDIADAEFIFAEFTLNDMITYGIAIATATADACFHDALHTFRTKW